ncbi:chemotaxis protein CheB [Aquimarina intermedia]|uniref:histidine kinase n=1 Tax=Aquimarina intermedia TaxID=350814 RepID=A0A5S5CCW9_9FLAO|nr:chemotaxis protein CheB [Aquimarina intermedia]TYP77204.1 two-component system CheB/CheR fusion protein [Aquimarina intermedia]
MQNKEISENHYPQYVVGVGASAGGLSAFRNFVKNITFDTDFAYILVQHLDPKHQSLLPELLQKHSSIPVREITDGAKIESNTIYVLPSNEELSIYEQKFKLISREEKVYTKVSLIDIFFSSLSKVYKQNTIGIVLSGTGNDGTNGIAAIKDNGGVTFAQEEQSAEWKDMPKSAIASGKVDYVVKPEEIFEKLKTLRNGLKSESKDEEFGQEDSKSFDNIINKLQEQEGADFSNYKRSTIGRRIKRRMLLSKVSNLSEYWSFIDSNDEEVKNLFKDLLIPVTEFFRNPETFKELDDIIAQKILNKKADSNSVRIWVAGCSTGQEAFSIAISVAEFIEKHPQFNFSQGYADEPSFKVQIFATDLNDNSIASARKGFFDTSQISGLSDEQLKKYFIPQNSGYQIKKKIRKMCVFAVHDFLIDYPFSSMDLVSCRNVMIYMKPYLQNKALKTFHYALKDDGILLLGQSETVTSASDLFEPIDKAQKIYKRRDVVSKQPLSLQKINSASRRVLEPKAADFKNTDKTDFQKNAEILLLKDFTPASVVVNQQLDLIHVHGKTAKYLEQPQGRPSNNLLKLAKGGLGFEIRQLVKHASATGKSQSKKNIILESEGKRNHVSVKVVPMKDVEGSHYLVIFKKGKVNKEEDSSTIPITSGATSKDLRIKELEEELLRAREELVLITEEQESVNEELQSANEELMSGTEELQSLNEELETSKEELQSTVEEITIANRELVDLNRKVLKEKQFSEAIVKTMRHPLLVLDKNLKVKMASNAFYTHFKVTKKQTLGKSIYELYDNQWNIPKLKELLEKILPKHESFKDYEVVHEFENLGQRTLLLNGQKLTQEKGKKEAILLVFEDITERKDIQNKLVESNYKFTEFVESSPWLIAVMKGRDMEFEIINDTFLDVLGKDKSIIGKSYKKLAPELKEQGFFDLMEQVYDTGIPYEAFKVPAVIHRNGEKVLNYYDFIYHPQHNSKGEIVGISIIATIVTDQVELFKKLEESEKKFNQLSDQLPDLITLADHKANVFYYNSSWFNFTGYDLNELKDRGWEQIIHPEDLDKVNEKFEYSLRHLTDFNMELRILNKNGEYYWFLSRAIPITNADGEVVWIGSNALIQNLKEEEKRKGDFLKLVSHELKTPITSIKGYVQLLLNMIESDTARTIDSFPLVPSLKRIDNQISRLTILIAEMLDLSRMDDSTMELHRTEFDLNTLVVNTVDDIKHSTGFTDIELSFDLEENVIVADEDRIGQVLINFITNALKYATTNNTIDVFVKQRDKTNIAVSVQDYGIGIAEEDQDKIFNKFYRVSGKNEATYAGFGIGLFLAKQIIERHKGTVEVQSQLGKGSTFTFIIPINN